jgi:hypothetical protein
LCSARSLSSSPLASVCNVARTCACSAPTRYQVVPAARAHDHLPTPPRALPRPPPEPVPVFIHDKRSNRAAAGNSSCTDPVSCQVPADRRAQLVLHLLLERADFISVSFLQSSNFGLVRLSFREYVILSLRAGTGSGEHLEGPG